jgi:hypothetical protein
VTVAAIPLTEAQGRYRPHAPTTAAPAMAPAVAKQLVVHANIRRAMARVARFGAATAEARGVAQRVLRAAQAVGEPCERAVLCEDNTISLWFGTGIRHADTDCMDDGAVVLVLEDDPDGEADIREVAGDSESIREAVRMLVRFLHAGRADAL